MGHLGQAISLATIPPYDSDWPGDFGRKCS
jgi:hypothetical protein